MPSLLVQATLSIAAAIIAEAALSFLGLGQQPPAPSWGRDLFGSAQKFAELAPWMPIMPGIHPRMASEYQGPTATRQLEPPGPLALHYGVQTPVSVVLAHVVYGAVLGGFYRLA